MAQLDIYQQFDRAFAHVSAFHLSTAEVPRFGRVVLKHGTSLVAYVHIWGTEMRKASAGGGGYDRASMAVMAAIAKITDDPADPAAAPSMVALRTALAKDDGSHSWQRRLEDEGIVVQHVI